MKKLTTILCFLFFLTGKAQVFTGGGGFIQDNGQTSYFALNVSGLPAQIDSTFGVEQVCVSINHPNVNELYISLQSPNGTLVELSPGSSLSGPDYVSTCFNSDAGTSITLGTSPYNGSFRPVGYLGRFNTGQPGNGNWNLIIHDGFPSSNAGTLISWDLKFGTAAPHPVLLPSSNLPIIFINTSQPITDFTTTVNMGIIDNGSNRNNITDAWNGYNGKININIRGNSTKNYPKKSYHVETADALGNEVEIPLLGMPSESDWVLCASYADKTLIRIPLAYDLFRSMGHYSPRYRNVELMLNNEYKGMYSFIEKPKRNSNRVDINKLEPTENSMPYVSGGYIIKIDRNDEPGWNSLLPGNSPSGGKFYYQYDYPKDIDITAQQKSYIQTYMNDFETLMNSPGYADPVNGYAKYIDVPSFVDFFIINELSKNVDAYRLSTYLYKKSVIEGDKLFIGPVWDYDIAWHNCNYGDAFNTAGWIYQQQSLDYPSPTWWNRFMQDTAFFRKVYCRWNELRKTILDVNYLNNYIDAAANALNESQQRNFKYWSILGAYIYPNPQNQSGANYWTEVSDLKNWIAGRITWMDANLWGNCVIGVNEEILAATGMNVYPNPMEHSTTFEMQLEKEADVSLCITDLAGREMTRYLKNNVPAGESKIIVDRNRMASGIYLYQLQIENKVRTGKLVVQ